MRRLAGLALLPVLAATATAQPRPTFEAHVELVRLDVVVEHRGEFVRGLGAADFEVLDNGVPQQVVVLGPGAAEIATSSVLVLDTSGSTVGNRLVKLRAAAREFLEGLSPQDSASLLGVGSNLGLVQEREAGRQAVFRALDTAKAGGATALHDAIYVGLSLADPREGRPIVLVLTDGADNISWLGPERVRRVARASEAAVYVVLETRGLLGRAVSRQDLLDDNMQLLLDIARDTGGRVWHARSLGDLRESFLEVLAELRARHLIRYEPRGVERDGWHEVKVRLKGRKGKVRTRQGYQRGPVAP